MKTIAELKDFASQVMLLKLKAVELGLYKTAQAIEAVTKEVGWEIAEEVKKRGAEQ